MQADVFEVIKKGDILLHHPYHSFVTSTQHFVEAAANDPKVLIGDEVLVSWMTIVSNQHLEAFK